MRIPSPIPKRRSRIVIIPLIDIMFFLLASFMMLALGMSKTENIKVNLPSASQSAQDYRPDMVNIAVDKSGAVWLEKKQISQADRASVLKDRFHANPDVPVYISGAKDATHGSVVFVLDFCGRKKATSRTPEGKMPGESHSSPREIQRYLGRISGPLLDRIDLHIEVPLVKFREISGDRTGETSAQIRERVVAARQRQHVRFKNKPKITCNARMGQKELKTFCGLDDTTKELLKMTMAELNFSARAYDRILKVARTIADLAESENIMSEHISEAIQYRSLDRQLWE